MATAFINKMLECPICFEQFRQPKALPCQHTFCLEPCLKDLVNSEKTSIECPICRKIHDLPNGGVDKFPNNFTILELLEESRKIFHGSPRNELRSRHSSPVPTAPSIEVSLIQFKNYFGKHGIGLEGFKTMLYLKRYHKSTFLVKISM